MTSFLKDVIHGYIYIIFRDFKDANVPKALEVPKEKAGKLHKAPTAQERDARGDSMKNYSWEPKHFQACYPQMLAGVYNVAE